jgi:hypothetical protein
VKYINVIGWGVVGALVSYAVGTVVVHGVLWVTERGQHVPR